jgi:excisionase family DNA binding protein
MLETRAELKALLKEVLAESLSEILPKVQPVKPEPEQILTTQQLATELKVTSETISDYVKAGKISCVRLGKRLFFLRSTVDQELKKINIRRRRA